MVRDRVMDLRGWFIAGLLASTGTCVAAQNQTQTRGLHSLFVASGKLFFGTATDARNFNDAPYLKIANDTNEFGLWVPENSQKWQPTEPEQNNFAFGDPDEVMRASKENRQMLRCHTLTWHSQLPNFVQTGVWTRATLTAAIQSHIANVVGHFKGNCYSWDVVNEALNDNGTFRDSVFFQTLGTEYIPISFAAAAAADPGAKLYYNDFNLETIPAKTDAAVEIVKLVQAAEIRIDGLGFQAHLDVGGTPNAARLTATLNRFVSLGLEVAYTELDIAHTQLPPNPPALQQQAVDYVSVVTSCLAVDKCVGIVAWQFTDKYSWVPSTFPGKGDACLYDANFTKKPAYTSVSSLLAAAATGGVNLNASTPTGAPPGVAATSTASAFSGSSNGAGSSSSVPAAESEVNTGSPTASRTAGGGLGVSLAFWIIGVSCLFTLL